MAESDSILQLGIEAARDGNRDEARDLFRLLTRQEPGNAQAWLWLAGVAETREERQAALERVIELDPSNEMALKGLQAMGVQPAVTSAGSPRRTVDPITAPIPAANPATGPAFPPPASMSADEAFAAELDLAFDDDFNQAPPNRPPRLVPDSDADLPTGEAGPARRNDALNLPPVKGDRPVHSVRQQRSNTRSAGSGNTLRLALLALIVLLGIGLLLLFFLRPDLFGRATNNPTTPAGGAAATSAASGGGTNATAGQPQTGATLAPDLAATQAAADASATQAAIDAANAQATADAAAAQTAAAPTPLPPTPNPADPAQANPQLVGVNTALTSNGWQYNFANAAWANSFPGPIGTLQPSQGRWVVVLMVLANSTGTDQRLPADFLVLKDSQNRVYYPVPAASTAYINTFGRGAAGDLSQEDAIPANGLLTSVPVLFDVPPGASNLVLFAPSNPSQGYQILAQVP